MNRKIVKDLVEERVSAGVAMAIRDLWNELKLQSRHRSSLKRAKLFSVGNNLKLNLACGPNLKTGWINVDLSEKADLQLDLREAFPFADESVSIIYSDHFFEHLDYPDTALKFLKESWRVLIPGGTFSVGVPDTEWALNSYVTNDEEYFRLAKEWHPELCNTRMHNLNYHFRQDGEHKYAYDFETLAKVLASVGFVSITRRSFNPDLDSETRKVGTLYIDAQKP